MVGCSLRKGTLSSLSLPPQRDARYTPQTFIFDMTTYFRSITRCMYSFSQREGDHSSFILCSGKRSYVVVGCCLLLCSYVGCWLFDSEKGLMEGLQLGHWPFPTKQTRSLPGIVSEDVKMRRSFSTRGELICSAPHSILHSSSLDEGE